MTGASMLFLINRYITPITVIIITEGKHGLYSGRKSRSPCFQAYDDPVWDKPVRTHLHIPLVLVYSFTFQT